MPDATFYKNANENYLTVAAAVTAYEVWQLPGGRAAVHNSTAAASTGDRQAFRDDGQWVLTKVAGVVLLAGLPVYWDHTNNRCTYTGNSGRNFFIGIAVADAESAATTVTVDLNKQPTKKIDLARDSFTTAIIKTAGAPQLNRRGGAHNVILDSQNEAQKVDALSKASFHKDANGIVVIKFTVIDDGAGTAVDVSVGVASATHATDADSIAQHFLMHLDANDVDIGFQSKDGVTTVAFVDSTVDYALGTTKEVWLDMRTPTANAIYIDGVRVLSGTTFSVNDAASEWKLLLHIEKTAAADIYEFDLEELFVVTSEQ